MPSWLGNYELDVAIEDRGLGEAMAAQYEVDLAHATEVVLTPRYRVRPTEARGEPAVRRARSGSATRVAAGAVSVGSALSAALTNRRALGAAESGLLVKVGALAIAFAFAAALWPRVIAWPLAVLGAWLGIAWFMKAHSLRRRARKREAAAVSATREASGPGDDGRTA